MEPIITGPEFLENIVGYTQTIYAGVYLELINSVAVIGIGAILFKVMRQFDETMATGYLSFRILESVACAAAALCPLLLLSLGQEYQEAGATDLSAFQGRAGIIYATRTHIAGILVPLFFGLCGLLLYTVLYRTKLLPRFISVWGFIAVILMMGFNLGRLDQSIGVFLVVPMILNEVFLGIWLIAKGFNPAAFQTIPAD
jgi:hypothetical protein